MTFTDDARRGVGVLVWLTWTAANVVAGFLVQLALTPVAVIGVVAGVVGYNPSDRAHCWMRGESHDMRSEGYHLGSKCETCGTYHP